MKKIISANYKTNSANRKSNSANRKANSNNRKSIRANRKTDKSKGQVLPVSKKFYAEICERVREACRIIGADDATGKAIVTAVNDFIHSGATPASDTDKCVMLAFALLRPEIEKALARSAAARRRALVRKGKSSRHTGTRKAVAGQKATAHDVIDSLAAAIAAISSQEQTTEGPLSRAERRRREKSERKSAQTGQKTAATTPCAPSL